MKTGMELVEELRKMAREVLLSSQETVDARGRGLFEAADLLQAWLREADEELFRDTDPEKDSSWIMWVRDKVFGTYPSTTRTEGKK